ncbi:hypothetical protein A0H81_00151 [Grifola frondosa]|uniref:Uncharacterized protein n=1 Tax=Grifola frondosa TaxID=5627 RepID=A0A1C7MVX6_GRIFR|nr:hypothetical protein A0H81_00151 [Grifola frondosa]
MSGHSASPAHQLRIAIALAALRHKPIDQSYEAYILDVQAKFPLSRSPSDGCEPWRARALLLEKNLKELQAKHQKDQTELYSLRKAQASGQDRSESPALVGGKKKQKKKTSTNTSSLTAVSRQPDY